MSTTSQTRTSTDSSSDALSDAADDVDEAFGPEEAEEMGNLDNPRRILFVHAHPDDEVTGTGVTMAYYAANKAHVALVTCTRGEEGEIHVDDIAHRGPDGEDTLGEHREQELAAAMAALGVRDYRFLGDPGEYRDSGMMGEPSNDRREAFWQVPVDDAARRLVAVIRELRPSVVVTYDERGGYGHPDHIQAHRVTMRAVELSDDPSIDGGEQWHVPKVYWTATPESPTRAALRAMKEAGDTSMGEDFDPDGDLSDWTTPDHLVTTVIKHPEHFAAKVAGWRAYPSQIPADSSWLTDPDPDAPSYWTAEHFQIVRGRAVPDPDDPDGYETDLFAGLV